MLGYIGLGLLVLIVVSAVLLGIFTVQQQTVAVIERFGKFLRIAGPGIHIKIPYVDQIRVRKDMRIQPMNVTVETKTKDNVFVKVLVSVQYAVMPEKVYDAVYKLANHKAQIEQYVFDVVRAKVPTMSLDDTFENKDDIARAVKSELDETMESFGYAIAKALVTDIDPDAKVKQAMNEINAAQRERVAANERGEAERILLVKTAEGKSESMKLHGEGIAAEREAIAKGISNSFRELADVTHGDSSEVMDMLLITQYFDAMVNIAQASKTNTLFVNSSPGAISELGQQLRGSVLEANAASSNT